MPSPKALVSRLPSQTLRQRSSSRRRSKLKVFLQGLQVLDGRSPAVRQYAAARRELVEQLGGPDNISAAQRFLIEMTVRGLIYLNHLDAHLLQQKSLILVNGKTRKSKDRKSQLLLLERMHIGVEYDHFGILGDGVILNGLNQLHSVHSRHFHCDNG